jgi:prepilin-type N-terminal cleavage/methylation domain-containing protein
MKGGKNRQPLGYTIIEVMIVLAVSGVMFLVAVQFINGKQARTSFTAGVNEMASQVQNIIEQVTDGQYSDIPFTCQGTPGAPLQNITQGGQGQGTNNTCVFLGKLLHFDSTLKTYEVYSLGAAVGAAPPNAIWLGQDVTPIVNGNMSVNLMTSQATPQNLDATVYVTPVGAAASFQSYGFGFTQSEGTLNILAPGTYNSGAQLVNLVYSPNLNSAGDDNESTAVSDITSDVYLASSVTVCLTDGTRYAQIGIGDTNANSNQLSVNVAMNNTTAVPPC